MLLKRSPRLVLVSTLLLARFVLAVHVSPVHAASAPTAGCGRTWSTGTDVAGTLAYGGLQRSYVLHIPKTYVPTTPVPLILNLHGGGMTSKLEEWLTGMSATSDAERFLVVYPQGTSDSSGTAGWDTYPVNSSGWASSPYRYVDDVGFLSALVTSLEGQLCVDTTRIGVTGMSEGAAMTYRMGCANLPWVAAIAPVAGTMPLVQSQCQMAHPTPLLAVNGVKDPVVWYNGYYPGGSVPQLVAGWAKADGCPTAGTTGLNQGDVTETVYSACTSGANTELYTVTDGGHNWPGGMALPWFGITSTAINASSLVGTFITTHPLH